MHRFTRINKIQKFVRMNKTNTNRTHNVTRIMRKYRFTTINRMYKVIRINTVRTILLELTKCADFRASKICTDLLELKGGTYLRTSTVHMGLLESTGPTGLQEFRFTKAWVYWSLFTGWLKLTEHTCLLGLIGGKGLKTLTGYTGLLKFLDWSNVHIKNKQTCGVRFFINHTLFIWQ